MDVCICGTRVAPGSNPQPPSLCPRALALAVRSPSPPGAPMPGALAPAWVKRPQPNPCSARASTKPLRPALPAEPSQGNPSPEKPPGFESWPQSAHKHHRLILLVRYILVR